MFRILFASLYLYSTFIVGFGQQQSHPLNMPDHPFETTVNLELTETHFKLVGHDNCDNFTITLLVGLKRGAEVKIIMVYNLENNGKLLVYQKNASTGSDVHGKAEHRINHGIAKECIFECKANGDTLKCRDQNIRGPSSDFYAGSTIKTITVSGNFNLTSLQILGPDEEVPAKSGDARDAFVRLSCINAKMPVGSRYVLVFVYNPDRSEEELLGNFVMPSETCPRWYANEHKCNSHPFEVRLGHDQKCPVVMTMRQRTGEARREADFIFSTRDNCDKADTDKNRVVVDAKDFFSIHGSNLLTLRYVKQTRMLMVSHDPGHYSFFLEGRRLIRFDEVDGYKETPTQICLHGMHIKVLTTRHFEAF